MTKGHHPVIIALDAEMIRENRRHEATVAGIEKLRGQAVDLFCDDDDPERDEPRVSVPPKVAKRGKAQSGQVSEAEVLGVLKGLEPGEELQAKEIADRSGYTENTVRGALAVLKREGKADSRDGPRKRRQGPAPQVWFEAGSAPLDELQHHREGARIPPAEEPEPDADPQTGPTPKGSSEPSPGTTPSKPLAPSSREKLPAGSAKTEPAREPDVAETNGEPPPELREKIMDALIGGRRGMVGLAQSIGYPVAQIGPILEALMDDGLVDEDDDLMYGLTDD